MIQHLSQELDVLVLVLFSAHVVLVANGSQNVENFEQKFSTAHIEITSLFLMANVIAFAHTVFHRNKIDRYDSQIKMVKSPLNMTRVCINIMLNSREAPQI